MQSLLTVEEVAETLRVATGTIYKYAMRGILPTVKVNGALRFRPEKIAEYVDRNSREARVRE